MTKCSFIEIIRGPKILDMSIFDWVVSIAIAVLVGRWIGIKTGVEIGLFAVIWVLFGVLTHAAFGINTMLGYYLGVCDKPIRKSGC